MKFLVFGESGQVARELQRLGRDTVIALSRANADLSNTEACAAVIATTDADAVINAAAYTAVDRAEEEEGLALRINGIAPGAMALAAAARGLPFVHISTDYVFDGSGDQPFGVADATGPLGAYGRTKLAGEKAVRAAGGAYAIFRTSWVVSSHGNNFVKTMLRLGAERDALNIVADQIGGPTPAAAIARSCFATARQLRDDPSKTGTYHLSGGSELSWADFARAIFEVSGIDCTVNDIPSSTYPTPAKRPLNSRLDNSRTQEIFGLARPDWREGLNDILKDLGALAS
ncbi:dTDP-4-dehydrorhamnose reductase (plasmid) [Sulfitobacter sp. OXR-159]|uniref:dTDP-4-dehydrorhamnose reductase n=1 Tax=Sulfitobacter sp. OXR-159 TaxID=3100174 RepID=UPI002AC9F16F|nr:dTDP-4-dehydrorhamnose reductase [Sulfitobacter sp. OXR-159]WPZ31531.1 dTDP-4-dehydrorhamnose reductase [Sulfitobacter sp. OXR-159]